MIKKPSISSLLQLLDKPALLNWSNKIGLQGISLQEYRKKSTSKGIKLHSQIKLFLESDIDFENIEHQNNFLDFIETNNIIEIYGLEKKVETQWFQGRYDIYLNVDGIKYMCDFKSSSKLYFENILQLVSYKMCESECKNVAIIQIPEFIFKPIENINFDLYEDIIKSLSSIYECKSKLKELGMIV